MFGFLCWISVWWCHTDKALHWGGLVDLATKDHNPPNLPPPHSVSLSTKGKSMPPEFVPLIKLICYKQNWTRWLIRSLPTLILWFVWEVLQIRIQGSSLNQEIQGLWKLSTLFLLHNCYHFQGGKLSFTTMSSLFLACLCGFFKASRKTLPLGRGLPLPRGSIPPVKCTCANVAQVPNRLVYVCFKIAAL